MDMATDLHIQPPHPHLLYSLFIGPTLLTAVGKMYSHAFIRDKHERVSPLSKNFTIIAIDKKKKTKNYVDIYQTSKMF